MKSNASIGGEDSLSGRSCYAMVFNLILTSLIYVDGNGLESLKNGNISTSPICNVSISFLGA